MNLPDPMDTVQEFQKALRRGLATDAGEIHQDIRCHRDIVEGDIRLTFARVEHGRVKALAVFVTDTPIDGKPTFNVGYAVPEHYRGRGWGTDVLKKAIDEAAAGLGRNGVTEFFVTAVVGRDNLASQALARKVLQEKPQVATDLVTGDPVLVYTRLIAYEENNYA